MFEVELQTLQNSLNLFMPKTKKIYDIFPPDKGFSPLISPEPDRGAVRPSKRLVKKALLEKRALEKKHLAGTIPSISCAPSPKRVRPSWKKWRFLLLGILILAVLFSYFYFPKAEITIWPRTEILNFEKTVILEGKPGDLTKDPGTLEDWITPGKIFEAERETEKNFQATGEFTKERKAKGVIRIYNNYQATQVLVQNTRLQPPLEKVIYFRTTKKITIPSKGYVDVEVIADQPGEDYNIGPSTFSVPGLAGIAQYYSVYGKSFSPMEGGFIGKVYKVTESDIKMAKESLTNELFSELKNYLKERIPTDFVLLEQTFQEEILEYSSQAKVDDETDVFKARAKVRVKSLLYQNPHLEELVKKYFLSKKPADRELQEDSLKIECSVKEVNWQVEKATLGLKSSVRIYSSVRESDLKEMLGKKNEREAREFLAGLPDINRVEIKLWPFWVKRVPKNIGRIDIKINF